MLWILSWLAYGIIVGLLAKSLHPGDDPIGFVSTVGIGIAGSYVGGFINFLLGHGEAFSPSGIIMGVVGGVVFCWIYKNYRLGRFLEMQKAEIEKLKSDKKDE